jgi:hypothetical protein
MVLHQLGHKAVDGASGSSQALENIRAMVMVSALVSLRQFHVWAFPGTFRHAHYFPLQKFVILGTS